MFPFCSAILNFVLVLAYCSSACTREQSQRCQTGFFLGKTKPKHMLQEANLICSGHKQTFSPGDWMRVRVRRNCRMRPESQCYHGLHQKRCDQQVKRVILPLYSILLSMDTVFTSSTASSSRFPNIGRTWNCWTESRGRPRR